MRIHWLFAGGAAVVMASSAAAQATQSTQMVMLGQGSPIATSILVPEGRDVVYVSGTVPDAVNKEAAPGSVERYGDTEAQTRSVLGKIERELRAHGMDLRNVVMMRVFLVAPPGAEAMDFRGMMKAYLERYPMSQPNKPARSTMEVAGLVDPGWLVEIEVTAAKQGK